MAKKGGKQPGAGRPKGSKNHLSIRDYMTEKDIETFFEFLMANYMEDSKLMIWVGDHLLGKAPQSIDHTTLGKELPQPLLNVLQHNDSDREDKEAA